jgi:hypothetical protein
MSLDQYLDLTEEDIQFLVSTDYGDSHNNPFHASVIKNPKVRPIKDVEVHDKNIDYTPDQDEVIPSENNKEAPEGDIK